MMKKPRIKFKRLELRSALVNRLWLFELFLVAAMCCLKALTATKTIKAAAFEEEQRQWLLEMKEQEAVGVLYYCLLLQL